jgi:type II secretory pathway pseudopilin PulG
MIRPATERRDRGFTILESFIALVVLSVGMLGLLALTSVGVRANYFGRRMAQAEELAHDLAEQVAHWDYSDARLTPGCGACAPNVTSSLNDTSINGAFVNSWDLGINSLTSYKVQYAEASPDSNAAQPGALALGTTAYSGALADPNPDAPAPCSSAVTGTSIPSTGASSCRSSCAGRNRASAAGA